MGGVIIYEPEEDSEVNEFPWTVTFEPSGGDEWDSFICGPYERDHAVALAEAVALDDTEGGVLAVVAPMLPALSAADVTATIEDLREAAAEEEEAEDDTVNGTPVDFDDDDLEEEAEFAEPPSREEIRAGMERTYRRLLEAE
ncbi:hypothetical protein [Nocardia sp. NRRL S-836]|uniref:hypothetical protein n=1 Tax=Nocardia sp. NRRL S-836 TaxID=1519492 RepID=UPI0006C4333B|nr:hypothetical protein [Nocardia sp. NRRL S-836]KOV80110.1 hypothetical protein ADL03_34690 [Nocardia sp. NRRL S-836]